MRIAVSGLVGEYSGIGVVQRALYPRLDALGFEVIAMNSRETHGSHLGKIAGLARGLGATAAGKIDATLSTVPPMPLSTQGTTVSMVHDLRWYRTRSRASGYYRSWDLKRTIAKSDAILAISSRTQVDLEQFDCTTAAKTRVLHLGPGQVNHPEFSPRDRGDVLLIGKAPHKRNELAATVLCAMPNNSFDKIIGVSLSSATRETLEEKFGASRCEWRSGVSQETLLDLYRRSRLSIQLSVEEGFGMPYLEALSMGCIVVAIDQPLTRELMGDAAVLVLDNGAESIAQQIESAVEPTLKRRTELAHRYSWDSFANGVATALSEG